MENAMHIISTEYYSGWVKFEENIYERVKFQVYYKPSHGCCYFIDEKELYISVACDNDGTLC